MPKPRVTICSFYVHRPLEHPDAADYVALLKYLDASCARLGLRHVVLTDRAGAARLPSNMEYHATLLPLPLMQAVTRAQADWLVMGDWRGGDTLMVGADCIMLQHPNKAYPGRDVAGLCVTLRPGHKRYPINTGAIMVRGHARIGATAIFQEVAARTGPKWGDDQRAIESVLLPMPKRHGVEVRHGLRVAFLPMQGFNDIPRSLEDRRTGATMIHFRGKGRKQFMVEWCERHMKGDRKP